MFSRILEETSVSRPSSASVTPASGGERRLGLCVPDRTKRAIHFSNDQKWKRRIFVGRKRKILWTTGKPIGRQESEQKAAKPLAGRARGGEEEEGDAGRDRETGGDQRIGEMSRWSVGKEGSGRIGERGRSSEEASARERGGSGGEVSARERGI